MRGLRGGGGGEGVQGCLEAQSAENLKEQVRGNVKSHWGQAGVGTSTWVLTDAWA